MTQEHPLTPPLELRQQWRNQWHESEVKPALFPDWMNICIAQWSADQELEACRQWLKINGAPSKLIDGLLAARRPEPPSLKRQALIHFESYAGAFEAAGGDSDLIFKALKSIPDPS